MEIFESNPGLLPRLIGFMVVLVGLMIFSVVQARRQAQKRHQRDMQRRKSSFDQESNPAGSAPVDLDDDDPLALLQRAREEALNDAALPSNATAPQAPPHQQPAETVNPSSAAPLPPAAPDPVPAQSATEALDLHRVSQETLTVPLDKTGTRTIDTREVMSIQRDERDKRLIVQFAEGAYRSLAEDDAVRKKYGAVMKSLAAIIKPDPATTVSAEDDELLSLFSGAVEAELHTISRETMQVQLSTGHIADVREVMSIQRDEEDGRIVVQMVDRAYRTLVDAPEVKARFGKVMKVLASTIPQPDDNPPPDDALPSVAAPAVTDLGSLLRQDPAPMLPAQQDPGSADDDGAGAEEPERLPGDLPSMTINEIEYERGRFGGVIVKDEHIQKAPEISVPEAIEQYLQYKIGLTPRFQNRGIHIRLTSQGMLSIDVEGRSFEFVEEIDDADVRQFVQTAIHEWQARNSRR